MPDEITSFWGMEDLTLVADSRPISLLKQQAALLSRFTGGKVGCDVSTSTEGNTVSASLYLTVPEIEDYQYKLLYIRYPIAADPEDPFPIEGEDVTYRADDSRFRPPMTFKDMGEFTSFLKDFLSSPHVKGAIGSLAKYGVRQ